MTAATATTTHSYTIHVSDASFEADVLKAAGPVLVDFWAEWCGPCKMIAPALDEIARDLGGKLTVAKINIDHNQQTPKRYGVRGIPTLMIFKDGQVAATKIGNMPKRQLADWVEFGHRLIRIESASEPGPARKRGAFALRRCRADAGA